MLDSRRALVSWFFVLLMAASLSAQIQYPDVLYLKFNEGSGTATADEALPGVASVPSLTGSSTWLLNNPKLGNAALRIPSGASGTSNCVTGAPLLLSADWTVEFWYYGQDTSQTSRILTVGATSLNGMRIEKVGFSSIQFSSPGFIGFSTIGSYIPNTWVHLAITFDSTANLLSFYVNGTLMHTVIEPPGLTVNIGSPSGLSIGGGNQSVATPFLGAIDEFRIWSTVRTQAEIVANRNVELNTYADDVAVLEINQPRDSETCVALTANEPVSFTLRNSGTNAIPAGTAFTAAVSVDGAPAIQESFVTVGSLPPTTTELFQFVATVDCSALGIHTVEITAILPGDQNLSNDGLLGTVENDPVNVISNLPWYENFESATGLNTTTPPIGWIQDQDDGTGTMTINTDWIFRSGATSTLNTGPTGDATTGSGVYAYVEDSGGDHPFIRMTSPCLDLSSISNPTLGFQLHSYNSNPNGQTVSENTMSVDVISYPGGIVTTDVFGPLGHDPLNSGSWANSSWRMKYVDLSPFIGRVVQLVFRASTDSGGFGQLFSYHDLAIDDVAVFDPTVGAGQPGQPGVAVLDINNAVNFNVGAGNPYSGASGPFRANVMIGSLIKFRMIGEPYQPAVLVFGPLNVASATYPNVGQADVGGAPDATGFPTLIQVVANGFNPVTFLDALFRTGATGEILFDVSVPPLPVGPIAAFQSVLATSNGNYFAISNAVELSIF